MGPFRWCFRLSGGILDLGGSISLVMSIILSQTQSCASECKLLEGPTVLLVSAFPVLAARLAVLLVEDLERGILVIIQIIPKPRLCLKEVLLFNSKKCLGHKLSESQNGKAGWKGPWRSQNTLVSKLCPPRS